MLKRHCLYTDKVFDNPYFIFKIPVNMVVNGGRQMRVKNIFIPFFTIIAFFVTINGFCAEGIKQARNPVPIPPSESGLPAETAEEWVSVSPANKILEGAIFDQDGNLLFCNVSDRKIMRVTPDKKIATVLEIPNLSPGGIALHKDGRLFMAALDLAKRQGAILAWSPETKQLETIIPVEAGYWPNDIVMAPDGGFYFSDFKGSATNPAGGIYYVTPDFKKITAVIPAMSQANGVALSPDGRTLWATEFANNRLHRAELENPSTVSVTGSTVPYHFTGGAPDSMRVDSDGNVYVALYGQGRVMAFNDRGIPIGQILLPEREQGLNLLSTSLAIQPQGKNVFIVGSNNAANEKAAIFKGAPIAGNE